MKKTVAFISCLFIVLFSFGQQAQKTQQPSQDIAYNDAISKIVKDYPNNFLNIQGNKLTTEVSADIYKSKVCVPGAMACKVIRFNSEEDKTASFQAIMFTTDKFSDASNAYKKIFNKVKSLSINVPSTGTASFIGKYEAVNESVGFGTSSLRLKTKNTSYSNLVAEVELINNLVEWEVRLNVYTKKAIDVDEEEGE